MSEVKDIDASVFQETISADQYELPVQHQKQQHQEEQDQVFPTLAVAVQPALHLLLDAGYGIPREIRPRQEKILAIAKQIANFLEWQQQTSSSFATSKTETTNLLLAPVTVIGCKDEEMKAALIDRLESLLSSNPKSKMLTQITSATNENEIIENEDFRSDSFSSQQRTSAKSSTSVVQQLPSHFSFARDQEHTDTLLVDAVYLSPDASSCLNPNRPPPSKVVVGLLIDRRIQLNRSLGRSQQLHLDAKRWPMEVLGDGNLCHSQEPLNVDTILEALQQWSWNSHTTSSCNTSSTDGGSMVNNDYAFQQASLQAFLHHTKRHPARPKHR